MLALESVFSENNQTAAFENDRWPVELVGLKPSKSQSVYYLNFSRIKLLWLKHAVKRFIFLQAATKSTSSCCSYINGLAHFSNFLMRQSTSHSPNTLDRDKVIAYMGYLVNLGLGTVARRTALLHLRTFHEIVVREDWLAWPEKALIYSSDFPKEVETMPRFIPEAVVRQLEQHLHTLPDYMRRLIIILLETGRRISEICSLPIGCLEQDADNDWYLIVQEEKLKKSYMIPISQRCAQAIQEQRASVPHDYLFPARRASKSPYLSARQVNLSLNQLAQQKRIQDESGKLWHFHAHQFRHTVGTRMINAGIPQVMVQRYLGHESSEMTARYAYIHDETLKSAFLDYQNTLVDIHGELTQVNQHCTDAKWLKQHVMAQALPNGACTLPTLNQRCPHANACLTCTHFRTDQRFLTQHLLHLEQTKEIIKVAAENGWQRQLEMNIIIKVNLERIIAALQEPNDE